MKILFLNETNAPFTEETFMPFLGRAEELLSPIPEKQVELTLIRDAKMRALNLKTRNKDVPTDVLSFANREVQDPALREPDSLGQIFISTETAQKNASEMNQSLEDEIKFLFIHGILHLLGYDHQTPEDEEEMKRLAYAVLGR